MGVSLELIQQTYHDPETRYPCSRRHPPGRIMAVRDDIALVLGVGEGTTTVITVLWRGRSTGYVAWSRQTCTTDVPSQRVPDAATEPAQSCGRRPGRTNR
jgi:hypothetical protein